MTINDPNTAGGLNKPGAEAFLVSELVEEQQVDAPDEGTEEDLAEGAAALSAINDPANDEAFENLKRSE